MNILDEILDDVDTSTWTETGGDIVIDYINEILDVSDDTT